MRKLILHTAILIASLICFTLKAQDVAQTINNQKAKIRELEGLIKLKDNRLLNLNTELSNARKKENFAEVTFLQGQLSSLAQEKQNLIYEKNVLDQDLKALISKDCINITSSELRIACEDAQQVLQDYTLSVEGTVGIIERDRETIEKLIFLNSYISNFDIGMRVAGGGVRYVKEYKNEKFTVHSGLFRDLKIINVIGKVYVPRAKPFSPSGKLLIYVNNKLYTVLDANLTRSNNINDYSEYELRLINQEIEDHIPNGSEVNLGFTDTESFLNNRGFYDNFWDAQSTGKFIISNVKPTLVSTGVRECIENCKSKRTLNTRSEFLYISIKDNQTADGDKAAILLNANEIFNDDLKTVFSEEKQIYLDLGENIISLYAISVGSTPPCTAILKIRDDNGRTEEIILKGSKDDCECIKITRE